MAAPVAKHAPQRTCVSCRRTADQREFARLVRTAAGTTEVDTESRTDGRGAYLCRSAACWQAALKGNRLSSALRTTLSNADRERLGRIGESLITTETDHTDDN